MKSVNIRSGTRPPRWLPRALGLGLLVVSTTWSGPASADDAPPPPPLANAAGGTVSAREGDDQAPAALPGGHGPEDPFPHLLLQPDKPDDTENEAWAFGGWITYKSGWLLDTFSMGASLYGSAPLYAPDDKDGTLLLKPGQEGYYVPAEAWGALRYKEYALLKGYRQRVDQTYINPRTTG